MKRLEINWLSGAATAISLTVAVPRVRDEVPGPVVEAPATRPTRTRLIVISGAADLHADVVTRVGEPCWATLPSGSPL
jgi:hypothetical protein